MNKEIVKVDAIYKSYRDRSGSLEILKNINFTVYEGEFLVIQGP